MNMHTAVLRKETQGPDSRRVTAARTGRLINAAVAFTVGIAVVAWLLASVVHLSEQAVVLSVMAVSFAVSWAITNRRPIDRHRVTMIPVRVHTH